MSDLEKTQCAERDDCERDQMADLKARVERLERELQKQKDERLCYDESHPIFRHTPGPLQ